MAIQNVSDVITLNKPLQPELVIYKILTETNPQLPLQEM
jgi:hypothetical protein